MIQTADADASAKLARAMFQLSLPGAVLQVVGRDRAPQHRPPRRQDRQSAAQPTAYACLGPQCSLPVTEPDALLELLKGQRTASAP